MDKILTLEPTGGEAAELPAAIERCFAEMDELRAQMRRDQAEIEASGSRTDAMLAEIANVLTELKAA